MDQEDVKKASLEPKTPIPNVSDSVSPVSSPSEEETIKGVISLSPLCNQYSDKMRIDSNLFDCVLVLSDEEIVESMYQSLLRIIVSLQIQGSNGEVWCFDDGCKTPPSRHSDSNLVPDTCPGAPMKLTKVSRNIDSGLRRKLF
ncbi:unnamed protein product [Microthlaspi erraticum]|uniref:Uncharacterized protein n=1 Tax=Microthlaspi erraticum TaxID=1685480 RepID=A0A6D2HNK8_9BRAS|nr:unnamed protein product [Microthlaspi erraticum]